jgi:predicted transposase/invertase (TIGR01784 family)
LFKEPEKRLELYNALSGSNLPLDTPITDVTLPDALFMVRVNDLAFVVDNKLVALIEHQSAVCENMPLRLLLYIARVYEKILENDSLYREALLKIPKPEIYVLYNGTNAMKDIQTVRLSDAFEDFSESNGAKKIGGTLELEVKIINANHGRNTAIVAKSKNLEDYAIFVELTRKYLAEMALNDAIIKAVNECIESGFLVDFLKINFSRVVDILIAEFNLEAAKKLWKYESRRDGRAEISIEISEKLLALGVPPEQVSEASGRPLEGILLMQKFIHRDNENS